MMYFNENQIIEIYLKTFKEKCKDVYDSNVTIKRLRMNNPVKADFHVDYKDGDSSSEVEIDFNLVGWSGFSDKALDELLNSVLEEDDNFFPIVNLEIYQFSTKGKLNVKLIFKFVFTRVDVRQDMIDSSNNGSISNNSNNFESKSNNINTKEASIPKNTETKTVNSEEKDGIIREIELRLSEIYTLLSKLK